jgi:hypothetical protein
MPTDATELYVSSKSKAHRGIPRGRRRRWSRKTPERRR